MKVCFISSSGGHFSQLLEFKKKLKIVDSVVITEHISKLKKSDSIYYLHQQDRKNIYFLIILFWNVLLSIYLYFKIKPKYVISTGAGAVLPFLIISKLFGSKIIFIESYSKTSSKTLTGRISYKFVDRFYVQWESMLLQYPKAHFKGAIY